MDESSLISEFFAEQEHSSPSRPESEPEDSKAEVTQNNSDQETVAQEEEVAEGARKDSPVRSDPEAPPLPDEAPPLPDEAPPLPDEAPPTEKADDGWQPIWDEAAQAFYFYNRFTQVTQWENPRVPNPSQETATHPIASNHDRGTGSVAPSTGGYNPAIHGDYDPNADYARVHQATGSGAGGAELAGADVAEAYAATGAFNRFTGRWQGADFTPDRFSEEAKSKRQMHAFFDVDAAANSHDGRSLRAERQQKKLSKKELKAFKEKRREKKEEKRRAWLKD